MPTQVTDNQAKVQSIFTGLIYESYEDGKYQVWQIGKTGQPRLLLPNHSWGMLSPDKEKLVYYDNYASNFKEEVSECVWYANFQTKETKPIDCSRGEIRSAGILAWKKGEPDTLIALLSIVPYMDGMTAYLGTIDANSGTKKILDAKLSVNDVSISPDGKTIAYGGEDDSYETTGWLYSWDKGLAQFDLKKYKVDYSEYGAPEWSPDGKKIVWGILNENASISVLNIEDNTMKVIHSYKPYFHTHAPYAPPESAWSPDGQWIATNSAILGEGYMADETQSGLWVINVDTQKKYRIEGWFADWSPDGQWVLSVQNWEDLRVSHPDGSEMMVLGKINDYTESIAWSEDGHYLAFSDSQRKIRVVEVGSWKMEVSSDVGAVAEVIGWSDPIPDIVNTMTILPTPAPPPAFDCPNAPRTRLQVGNTARTSYSDGTPTRLRSKPEVNGNVVDNLPEGTEFEIVDGPVCALRPQGKGSFVYWQVNIPSRKVEGWIAEGDLDGYYIEPWP
jgi:dipeptidyl aminopeptidase/acylaminoacyl peptidase